MSIADENLERAKEVFRVAVSTWDAERGRGGIVELDRTDSKDAEDWKSGQRWKTTTTDGARAMGHFQKAKADMDHAAAIVQAERGRTGCPTCPRNERPEPAEAPEYVPDVRLPPERDDEVFAP